MNNGITFYEWLSLQFSNYEQAVIFVNKFVNELQQDCPYGCFSQRAICGHCSAVLEGNENYNMHCSYINTKYGIDLYWSIKQ